jgi:SAM-dependent methyltransferase
MICRGCGNQLSLTFLDLGVSPIANNLIDATSPIETVQQYPLKAMVCEVCSFVQLSKVIPRETLFPERYLYHSSYSTSWLAHCKKFAQDMVAFLDLTNDDLVVEIASNDGYLLQYFMELGVQVKGIEPSLGVAELAKSKGIPTIVDFFGENLANTLVVEKKPRLIIGNNVIAHVPDIHDFIRGLGILLDEEGIITLEFPHIYNLIKFKQFDTVYHEHLSYLSLTSLKPIFLKHNLKVFKIEKLDTHGGSLRVYLAKSYSTWKVCNSVHGILGEEKLLDPRIPRVYGALQDSVISIKNDLNSKLQQLRNKGFKIAAYGAAAKGVTLLNFCGVGRDLIDYVVDLNPNKQGKFLPGCLVPIVDIEVLNSNPPDVLLILPWNLSLEIKAQLCNLIESGMQTMRAIPKVELF